MLSFLSEPRVRTGVKLVCVLGVLALTGACDDDDDRDPFSARRTGHVMDLRVARSNLAQDDTVTVVPAVTEVATGDTLKPAFTFRSTEPTVASVSGTGLVRALLPGTTRIISSTRFNDSTYADTVVITVNASNAATSLAFLTPDTAVFVGDTKTLRTELRNAAGTVLTTRARTFTSLDTALATVSSAGVVTTKALGTVRVRLSAEGLADTITLNIVQRPVATVIVTPNPANVRVGQTVQLTAETRAANGAVLTGRTVTWVSDNPAIATVHPTSGLVTGVAGVPGGTAVLVRAISEGVTGGATVIVRP